MNVLSGSRVKDTSTANGAGALALDGAASARFFGIAAVFAVDVFFSYSIKHKTLDEWETGIGRLVSGSLDRVAVDESSNGDDFVSFSSGTKEIYACQIGFSAQLDFVDAWGDAADGDLILTSGTITSTTDLNLNKVVFAGGSIDPGGFKIKAHFADFSNAVAGSIFRTAAAGLSGAAGGTSPAALTGGTIGGGAQGTTGGAGGTATGSAGTSVGANSAGNGGSGGDSGNGGLGASGAGGAGGAGSAASVDQRFRWFTPDLTRGATLLLGGGAGRGGGGGGGDGTAGGRGGGGGTSGAVAGLYFRVLKRGASTAAGAIRFSGANGGDGQAAVAGNRGGGGGGGAGGGGWVYLAVGRLIGTTATAMIHADGGDGGAGGAGFGTGVGGNGGRGGQGGHIDIVLASGVSKHFAGPVGAVGTTASGTVPGTGGAGGQNRVDV